MQITSITTEEFQWPRRVPIRNGKHTYTHSGLGIVRIETDENITGIGLEGTGLIGQATMGLWDIRAKVARLPLYKLLGGFRNRMPTYIAGGY